MCRAGFYCFGSIQGVGPINIASNLHFKHLNVTAGPEPKRRCRGLGRPLVCRQIAATGHQRFQ
jgi:hypothetical protein